MLRILSEVGGENIVATDDVKGRITVRLVDVPWDQALDIVLQANRLDSIKIGNVRRVSTVTRLKEEREAQLAAEQAAKELEPLRTAYIRVNYLKVTGKELLPNLQGSATLGSTQQVCANTASQGQSDQGDKLVDEIKDVLSDRGKVRVDARSNTVIVRDIQRGIDAARDLLAKLDVPTPQVLIESNIVEATDTFARDLGIQWGYNAAYAPQFGNAPGKNFPGMVQLGGNSVGPNGLGVGNAPTTGAPNLPGLQLPQLAVPFIADFPASTVGVGSGSAFDLALGSIDGSKQLDARITALEKEGKAKVISRPKVTTANNQPACIASVLIQRVRLPERRDHHRRRRRRAGGRVPGHHDWNHPAGRAASLHRRVRAHAAQGGLEHAGRSHSARQHPEHARPRSEHDGADQGRRDAGNGWRVPRQQPRSGERDSLVPEHPGPQLALQADAAREPSRGAADLPDAENRRGKWRGDRRPTDREATLGAPQRAGRDGSGEELEEVER